MTKEERIEAFNEKSGFLRIYGDLENYAFISPDVIDSSKIETLIKELTEAKEILGAE